MQTPRRAPVRLALLVAAATLAAPAASALAKKAPAKPAAPPPPAPPPPPPPSKAGIVDEAALDRSVDPCTDFYQFACGSWMKNTPIPGDRAQWTRSFSEIFERNLAVLRDLLEKDAAGTGDGPLHKELGDFYGACMDESKAETASRATLADALKTVDGVRDGKALARLVADLQLTGIPALMDIGQQQDFADATQVIAYADQGGLSLPDRDYYTNTDEKSVAVRKDFVAHVAKMLALAGAPQKDADKDAQKILDIETQLAQASLRRVERRDPRKIYHRIERKGLAEKAPHFDWDGFFAALGIPSVTAVNVAVPDFFVGLDKMLVKMKPADWKPYLRWHLIHASARALGKAFVDEDFNFMTKRLTGAAELKPRWKRCVEATDGALGFALAQAFVQKTFGEEGKVRSKQMLDGIEAAFRTAVQGLPWMDEPTKAQALDKLTKIVNKIGYPDTWRSYAGLQVDRTSYLANLVAATRFEGHRQLAKIGKPVDRTEWFMTPPTVNAYYEPSLNEMVFPAGILQPPFFNTVSGDSTNYGGIGMVIGHELTHGFDDEGRKFDGAGNLRDWWSPEVGKRFDERTECVAQQYSGYVAVGDTHLDGHLTLGENIADLGGIKLAYAALQAAKAQRTPAALASGFTEEQQFFLGFAQGWCTNRRDEEARRRVMTDPHSPPKFRVNGVIVNTPEFGAAFQCKAGAPMNPAKRCSIW